MSGLGHTARGLFVACLALAALVATTLAVIQRWPLTPPRAEPSLAPVVGTVEPSDDRIRVALTRQPVLSVEVRIEGAFQVASLNDSHRAESFFESLHPTRVAVENDGIAIGDRPAIADGVELVPERSPGVWIDGRKYRGVVRLHVTDSGRVWPVNVLSREEYLAAVVDAEMPAAFPAAARQAQAIVARTYAISCQQNPRHRWFDLYSTPVSQNYLGVVYRDAGDRLLAGETPAG
ncbi:MAG: SpoIID/LytB domain-containing protein, partial [Planctomycetaceae bacterium]